MIRESIQCVDPVSRTLQRAAAVVRRVYNVPCPISYAGYCVSVSTMDTWGRSSFICLSVTCIVLVAPLCINKRMLLADMSQ